MKKDLSELEKDELIKRINQYQSKLNELNKVLKEKEQEEKRIGFKWY